MVYSIDPEPKERIYYKYYSRNKDNNINPEYIYIS
jgi:hypothetical protein